MLTLLALCTVALLPDVGAAPAPAPAPSPVQVVYTGEEGCACPTQLGYQLNVPSPSKPKKYEGGEYGYRVEKPVQTKAKISYSFDFTVEQPRTPAPAKIKPSKLYAKVDRVTVNKSDCQAQHKASCSCSSCTAKPRYVVQQSNSQPGGTANANAIRRRRDLRSPGALLRKRLLRQQQLQERPPRYVKFYHKDLDAQQRQQQKQQKLQRFGLLPQLEEMPKAKRKSKKAPAQSSTLGKRWLGGLGRRMSKRDIKGEYDLLEQERAKIDLTAPEIIQFMPETLDPGFKRGPCPMSCGAITATAPPATASGHDADAGIVPSDSGNDSTEQPEQLELQPDQAEQPEAPTIANSIPAKRAALGYYPPQQIPSPLIPLSGAYNEYKFVDDSQLRTLLSTTSVPDPLEQNSTPLQFAGDLESVSRRNYAAPAVLGGGTGGGSGGYPVEHVADTQLDSIISGIVYQHPEYVDPNSQYGGTLVDPEPVQKKQTTDFLKKLIDGRLGGWGFDTATEPESAVRADYSTKPSKTYGYNSRTHDGYSVDTYNVPPISDYLRAWF
ncbi:hypothetical protein KR222_004825 [Zaprionus bogoriensis]|nr:hypothetical protein KR222_004825 [Zaprionus bogoriensis]